MQDLERFLQESYKICKKRSKILPDSCRILAKILHDISGRVACCNKLAPARNSTASPRAVLARWRMINKPHGFQCQKIALTTGLNCTQHCLVQLLAYLPNNFFFQIALNPMWLPIQTGTKFAIKCNKQS